MKRKRAGRKWWGMGEDAFGNAWYVVASSRELRPGQAKTLRRFGQALALFRDREGQAHCLSDRCPHRGASLGLGRVKGGCIECPFHGFRFDGEGACTAIPAQGEDGTFPAGLRAKAFATEEAHGFIWLWSGDGAPVGRPAFFDALDGLHHSEFTSDWHAHYTRVIENQVDYAHLPFVHRTTLGLLMPNPKVEVETRATDTSVRVWASGHEGQYVEWKYPNIWVNRLSDRSFIFLAFVPVDATHTRIYCRNYQSYLRWPGARGVVGFFANALNRWILEQDQSVVESQRPYPSHLGMDEQLLPLDAGVSAYRRIRHRLEKPSPPALLSPGGERRKGRRGEAR